jgi:Transposase DDE domain/Domain of unknown function (DUF4372)
MNRVCSIFHQLLELFPRWEFRYSVEQHRGERHARGFTCWEQFVAMLFCQLAQAQSLREICGGLASCQGKLLHLGLEKSPRRSTLAYANQHRPWELYKTLFEQLYEKCRGQLQADSRAAGKPRLRIRRRLLTIDASLVFLCEKVFDWAEYHRGKGALKLHLVLDHQGYLPRLAVIGSPNEPEVKVARQWRFPRGAVLLFDKAYTDYSWFDQLTEEGVGFVTRMRRDAHYEMLEQREPPAGSRVCRDSIIRLGAERRKMRQRLRRIELSPLPGHDEFVLLTNNLRWSAATVAELYGQRWQIEQFFRALKQNLRLKSFVGTSANAVLIQIWTALIAMLLLKYLMLRSRFGWSLSNLVALLRLQLFVYRDLQAWLDEPLRAPPTPQALLYEQLQLPLGPH